MTSTIKNYPTRVTTTFQKKRGQIVLDQIRTVDKQRLIKKLGTISSSAQDKTLNLLQEMFAPWVREPNPPLDYSYPKMTYFGGISATGSPPGRDS